MKSRFRIFLLFLLGPVTAFSQSGVPLEDWFISEDSILVVLDGNGHLCHLNFSTNDLHSNHLIDRSDPYKYNYPIFTSCVDRQNPDQALLIYGSSFEHWTPDCNCPSKIQYLDLPDSWESTWSIQSINDQIAIINPRGKVLLNNNKGESLIFEIGDSLAHRPFFQGKAKIHADQFLFSYKSQLHYADLQTGATENILYLDSGYIGDYELSSSQDTVFIAGTNGKVYMYHFASGELLNSIITREGALHSILPTPEGNALITATKSGDVSRYDLKGRKYWTQHYDFQSNIKLPVKMLLSPNGKYLICNYENGGYYSILDVETGEMDAYLLLFPERGGWIILDEAGNFDWNAVGAAIFEQEKPVEVKRHFELRGQNQLEGILQRYLN